MLNEPFIYFHNDSVTSVSPNVEGMTAISAWMIVCILFVFAALAGYAYLVSTEQFRDFDSFRD